jgi:hypothetical protein
MSFYGFVNQLLSMCVKKAAFWGAYISKKWVGLSDRIFKEACYLSGISFEMRLYDSKKILMLT